MSPKDLAALLLNCLFSFRECVVMEVVEAQKKNGCHLTFLNSTVCFKDVESFSLNREAKKFEAKKIGSRPVYIIYYNKLSVGWVSDGLKF